MKYTLPLIAAALIALTSCSPSTPSTDKVQAKKTAQAMSEAQKQIGMPEVTKFQQRKLMKMIYEQCDREDLVCYAYLQAQYTGKLIYVGKCMGYGIPFSAQFTNPERLVNGSKEYGYKIAGDTYLSLPQADPNGLFMPTSSSATWLLMVDPETNKPRPVYFEPTIVVSPFKLPTASQGSNSAQPE